MADTPASAVPGPAEPLADQRPRRAMTENQPRRKNRRRRRRRAKRTTKWQKMRHILNRKWVQLVLSMSVLTLWLRISAEDFDKTELKTLSLQAVSVIVLHMLGKK